MLSGVGLKMSESSPELSHFDLMAFLKSRRAGFVLAPAFVQQTHDVLVSFGADSPEAVLGLGADVVLQALIDDEKDVNDSKAMVFEKWLANVTVATKTAEVAKTLDEGESLATSPLPRAGDSGKTIAYKHPDLEGDMKKMNLSGEEITALSLSIETGHVHTLTDVLGVPYGDDPKLSTVAKARRKAEMDSLTQLLKDKDALGVIRHLSNLVRDLTASGHSNQVAVVTAFLMEMQTLFESDRLAMIGYLREYLRKYRGRAFPEKFDFGLYAQATAPSNCGRGGGLTDEQKEQLKSVKTLKSQVESLTTKCQSMGDAMKTIRNVKPGGGFGDKTCNFCGQKGHFADRCKLNPDSQSFDAAYAAKKSKDKAGAGDDE